MGQVLLFWWGGLLWREGDSVGDALPVAHSGSEPLPGTASLVPAGLERGPRGPPVLCSWGRVKGTRGHELPSLQFPLVPLRTHSPHHAGHGRSGRFPRSPGQRRRCRPRAVRLRSLLGLPLFVGWGLASDSALRVPC